MYNLSFNGITKPYITVLGVERPTWAPIKRTYLTVPGMPGAHLQETQTDIKPIKVKILVNAADYFDDLQKLKEDMAEWLFTEKDEELIFENELNRIYFAAVDGSLDLDELAVIGRGTITFICSDPYKYSHEKKVNLIETPTFNVEGSVESDPLVKIELKQDTTYLAVSDGEQLNLIGNPIEPQQIPFESETRRLRHECNSLVGWGATASIEGGTNRGTLKSNGYAFYTDDYGADTGWHGPAMKRSIGVTLQDFKADILLSQKGQSGQIGSVEIALLDANNQIVAKMLMTKRSAGSQANWARLRAGNDANGHDIMNDRGAADWVWANFDGIFRIIRNGTSWAAYVAKIGANGEHHSSLYRAWTDTQGLYTGAISQVQVQLWQYGSTAPTTQIINDIKVYEINQAGENEVPIIGRAGDVIEFDHQTDNLRRNGENITREKAFIGEYFPLKKGKNTLFVEPADAVQNVEVRWRNRWR